MNIQRFVKLVAGVILLFVMAGCVSTGPIKTARIIVGKDGRIRAHGKDVRYSELPDQLKKMGAVMDTNITISAHYNVSDKLLYSMKQSLIKAGYPRVIIAKKVKPEAVVGERQGFKKTNNSGKVRPPRRRALK